MDAGERMARERIEVVYAAVDRLTPEELSNSILTDRDPEERAARLAELERLARRHGRGPLLEEARERLVQEVAARVTIRPWAGVIGMSSVGRADDIAEVRLALEDAVSVAVVEDLLDPADADALREPGRALLGLPPLGDPGAAAPSGTSRWEPSPADWVEAASNRPAAVDREEPMGGNRGLQAGFFATLGTVGVIVALVAAADSGEWGLGMLAGVTVAAVAWTLARYRRAVRP